MWEGYCPGRVKGLLLGEPLLTLGYPGAPSPSAGAPATRSMPTPQPPPPQITQLKIASNPFAKGFRDCDPEDW